MLTALDCARCGTAYAPDALHGRCRCGGTLLARYDLGGVSLPASRRPARPGCG